MVDLKATAGDAGLVRGFELDLVWSPTTAAAKAAPATRDTITATRRGV
jgi:hypothetical protein